MDNSQRMCLYSNSPIFKGVTEVCFIPKVLEACDRMFRFHDQVPLLPLKICSSGRVTHWFAAAAGGLTGSRGAFLWQVVTWRVPTHGNPGLSTPAACCRGRNRLWSYLGSKGHLRAKNKAVTPNQSINQYSSFNLALSLLFSICTSQDTDRTVRQSIPGRLFSTRNQFNLLLARCQRTGDCGLNFPFTLLIKTSWRWQTVVLSATLSFRHHYF